MANPDKIFAYCERGLDPGFWAEPLNAVTNAGFILAGLASAWLLMRRPGGEATRLRALLTLDLFVIGIGSFLFHTLATPRAALADVIPIGAFMLGYLGYALYVFAGLPLLLTIPAIAGFAAVTGAAMSIDCEALGRALPFLAGSQCLNGSLGYLPALAAMLLTGAWLLARRHPAAPCLLAAGLAFLVSLVFRSADRILCQSTTVLGTPLGTHFLWHTLNSLVLFLLMLGAIRHGGRRRMTG